MHNENNNFFSPYPFQTFNSLQLNVQCTCEFPICCHHVQISVNYKKIIIKLFVLSIVIARKSVTLLITRKITLIFFNQIRNVQKGQGIVFKATFNNNLVISWQSDLLVDENQSTWRKPQTCRKSLTYFITYCCIQYTSPRAGLELTMLVVIGTDYTGNCKSNYHQQVVVNPTIIRS